MHAHRFAARCLGLGVAGLLAICGCGSALPSANGRLFPQASKPIFSKSLPQPPTKPYRTCNVLARSAALRKPPASASKISIKKSINAVVSATPAHSVFWVEPGVHQLSSAIAAKDGDTFIGAPGAILDGGRKQQVAFTSRATNVTLSFLTVQHFGRKRTNVNNGVVNFDRSAGWKFVGDTFQSNAGAGVSLGDGNVVYASCLKNNGQYGFNALDASHVSLIDNEIKGNGADSWPRSCGCSGGGKAFASKHFTVKDNYVVKNHGVGIWIDTNNRGVNIERNYFQSNWDPGIQYEISYNGRIVGNTFVRNAIHQGVRQPKFPAGAIFLLASGSTTKVHDRYGHHFVVDNNRFVNNWSGVIAWEDANRFCGSPSNANAGACTLGNPKSVNVKTCGAVTIRQEPWRTDCRWRVTHLQVEHNEFYEKPSVIGNGCSHSHGCGFVGLFASYGTTPSWSPYRGRVIQRDIREQHNVVRHNFFSGPWLYAYGEYTNRKPV